MSFQIETVIVADDDVINFIVSPHYAGMQFINDGLYGTVYGFENSNEVVKVFKASDDGYFSYLKVIQQLGDGAGEAAAYLPKISKVIHYRKQDSYYDLDPESDLVPGYTDFDRVVVYMERLDQPARRLKWRGRPYTLDRFVRKLIGLLARVQAQTIDWSELRPKHRDLLALLELARCEAGKDYYDLHTGNVMARGGHFVVTDPMS